MLDTDSLELSGWRTAIPIMCRGCEHRSGLVNNPENDRARQQRRSVNGDAMRKLTEMREFLAERTIGRIVAYRKTIWTIG
jgi:hypothetical protein